MSQDIRRFPRGSTNIKNESNDIFKFGGSLDYEQGAKARYDRTPVVDLEKNIAQRKKEKEAARYQLRRDWLSEIERSRWTKMAYDYCKKEQDWINKHNQTKMGKNSVSYNPINLDYHQSTEGKKLREEDAKALVGLA
ncbi:hypothetical protein HDU84_002259 [Entophlyctis sp. JEL0112]|nr:hypothetical protein HDU84_002259 [Entophlyctis sp. JEL0112]